MNANVAAAESLILPALELNERMLKVYCVLVGCNPVLTDICYYIMIWKGREWNNTLFLDYKENTGT